MRKCYFVPLKKLGEALKYHYLYHQIYCQNDLNIILLIQKALLARIEAIYCILHTAQLKILLINLLFFPILLKAFDPYRITKLKNYFIFLNDQINKYFQTTSYLLIKLLQKWEQFNHYFLQTRSCEKFIVFTHTNVCPMFGVFNTQ